MKSSYPAHGPGFLLWLGVMAPLIFWLATAICGIVHGDYNHFTGTISELGAIGTRSQTLFSALIFLAALCGSGFVCGLFIFCVRAHASVIPVIPMGLFCLSLGGIAFFPQGNDWHPIVGQLSLPVLLSPLLALVLWRRKKDLSVAGLSWLTLVIMAGTLGIFIGRPFPAFQGNYPGLMQRCFHFGWSVWFAGLSLYVGRSARSRAK